MLSYVYAAVIHRQLVYGLPLVALFTQRRPNVKKKTYENQYLRDRI